MAISFIGGKFYHIILYQVPDRHEITEILLKYHNPSPPSKKTLAMSGIRTHNFGGDRYCLHKYNYHTITTTLALGHNRLGSDFLALKYETSVSYHFLHYLLYVLRKRTFCFNCLPCALRHVRKLNTVLYKI